MGVGIRQSNIEKAGLNWGLNEDSASALPLKYKPQPASRFHVVASVGMPEEDELIRLSLSVLRLSSQIPSLLDFLIYLFIFFTVETLSETLH